MAPHAAATARPSSSWKAGVSVVLNVAFSRPPPGPKGSTPPHTWRSMSTTCAASMTTRNSAPSSEAKESRGASVPEVSTTERASDASARKMSAGLRHQRHSSSRSPGAAAASLRAAAPGAGGEEGGWRGWR